MPNYSNYNLLCLVILFFNLVFQQAHSKDFSSAIKNVTVALQGITYELNADIDYHLSPTAKEAIQKGIPLNWVVTIKVQKNGVFWDDVIEEIRINYQIRNHALLNLYSVVTSSNGKKNMFSSLIVALDFMSKIRDLKLIEKQRLQNDIKYTVNIQTQFNRESLPTPLRPTSYFDSEWALSSPQTLWQLQN